MTRSEMLRSVGVLALAAVAIALVWSTTRWDTVCPAVHPPSPDCVGTSRGLVAAVSTWVVGALAVATVLARIARPSPTGSRVVAVLGVPLACAMAVGAPAAILQGGFVVDATLVATVGACLACAVGTVLLTRRRAHADEARATPAP